MSQFGTSRHAVQPPTVESGCSGIACEVGTAGLLLLFFFGVVLGALATIGCLRLARKACSEERRRVLAESEAFEAFERRVAELNPVEVRSDGGLRFAPTFDQSDNPAMERVRSAYRDTVMGVDHYEEDYGESLPKHMSEELGADVAAAVVGNESLTPPIRNALVGSAKTASREREILADTLACERNDLTTAEERLETVSERFARTDGRRLTRKTFPELESRWHRLSELEDECDDVLTERQRSLQDRSESDRPYSSPVAFSEYLYYDLDVSFPVLAAGTDLLEELTAEKRHTLQALTRRRS